MAIVTDLAPPATGRRPWPGLPTRRPRPARQRPDRARADRRANASSLLARFAGQRAWLAARWSALSARLRAGADLLRRCWLTSFAWTAVGGSVVAGVGYLLLDWTELLAIGLVLALTVTAALAFVLGRRSYEVTIDLASSRVVVGEPAAGELKIRNTAEKSVAPTLIELPVGGDTATVGLPRLAAGEVHETLFNIPTRRRAVLTLGPVRSVRSDPFALLRRLVEWTQPEDIYIHPKTVRLDNDSAGLLRDLEGLTTRDLSNDDVSFHALREYVPGDDLRYVHWRSTARTNKLMIRQFEETRRSQLVVLVSTRLADYASEDEFEIAISAAASLTLVALREGRDVVVFTSDAELGTETPVRALDRFAGVEPSRSTESFADRARVVAAEVPGASVVALVVGSQLLIGDLRVASLRLSATARAFAVRVASAEELARKVVGELPIVTIPQLDDLALAVRAVTA